jgi:hypothetical protein
MYHLLYKCKVTNVTTKTAKVAPGQIAKNCEKDPSTCVIGPKQVSFRLTRLSQEQV